jgi:hypothetical protein
LEFIEQSSGLGLQGIFHRLRYLDLI